MLVKTFGSAIHGIEAIIVTVEVSITNGINFFMVGLPDSAVKESQQRISTALESSGYKMPGRKIVINMAPADIRKAGSSYDLTLAIGILAASGQIPSEKISGYLMIGELSLDGGIRPVKGVLPIAIMARECGFKGFIVPQENAREAAIVTELDVRGVTTLSQVAGFLSGTTLPESVFVDIRKEFLLHANQYTQGFEEVKGQENVKRALEVAAAGGHNVLMVGSPGSGKTMLAKRFPGILPPLTLNESLETTIIHSVAGRISDQGTLITRRPFRSPHCTISAPALAGGGRVPQPGEISLAHNGVLFLDELPEFTRSNLELLRQPLEDRVISLARVGLSVTYPAGFMLLAAMNPCPCGFYNHPDKDCTCSPGIVQKYLSKISGPLLDRIDIHLELAPVSFDRLTDHGKTEPSSSIRKRVIIAREIQEMRFEKSPSIHCNAQMNTGHINKYCRLENNGKMLLKNAMVKLNLSARAYNRILKLARTIADLDHDDEISVAHIAEAIQYRSLDRQNWAG